MRQIVILLATVFSLAIGVSAQYGTAPNNYYPDNKTETFTGVFETGCSVPARDGRRMMPIDIPTGTVMTTFYNAETKKVDGKKIKQNLIIAIAFEVWQGQKGNRRQENDLLVHRQSPSAI